MKVLVLTILIGVIGSVGVYAQTPPVPPPTQPPVNPQQTALPQPANPTQQDLQITRPRQDTPTQTTPGAPYNNSQTAVPQTRVPAAPGQNVGSSTGAAPANLPADPPPIAPNFEAPLRPMPSAERVGVDIANQLPLTIEEAIELALRNNNDIDTSRNDVQIAEFNFRGARGVYDSIIGSEGFYESRTTPTASTIGGATNGSVTQSQFFGNAGVNGFSPFY